MAVKLLNFVVAHATSDAWYFMIMASGRLLPLSAALTPIRSGYNRIANVLVTVCLPMRAPHFGAIALV